jgi:hypothetical protein
MAPSKSESKERETHKSLGTEKLLSFVKKVDISMFLAWVPLVFLFPIYSSIEHAGGEESFILNSQLVSLFSHILQPPSSYKKR